MFAIKGGSKPHLVSTNSQRVGYPIDIVKPGCNQRNLQNAPIVKARHSQPLMILPRKACGVVGELSHVVEHEPIRLRNRSRPVVLLQGPHQLFVKGNATQKLCVGLDSIMTTVGDRHHGGDHFMLSSGKRQIRRHQGAERGKGVIESVGYQAVGSDNVRTLTIWSGVDGRGILDWIQLTLRFHGGTQLFVSFREWNGFDPSHE